MAPRTDATAPGHSAPAPYRVAIAPIADAPTPSPAEGELWFTYAAGELRTRLVRALVEADATTSIVAVGELDLLEAQASRADLLLRLRVTRATPSHTGLSGLGSVGAGLLWFGTWAGGLFVPDCRYEPGLEVVCTAISPHDGRPLARFALTSSSVNLRFVDRNPFFSAALAQSLILPPFWTTDDPRLTSHALSEIGTEHIARQVVQVLGELERPHESQSIRIEFQQPVNGGRSGVVTRLRARVEALGPIESLSMRVNGVQLPAGNFDPARDRLPGFDLDLVVRLQPGRNEIQIEARQGSAASSRTLVLHCDEATVLEELDDVGAPATHSETNANPSLEG